MNMHTPRLRVRLLSGVALTCAAILATAAVACTNSSGGKADQRTSQIVDQQQKIYNDGQPIPVFNYSQTRQTLIEIYKAKTATVNTYSVVVSFGKPMYVCPSIGYPIPATTQLTAPEREIHDSGSGNGGNITVPQAEPDGTFTGTTQATYVVCVLPDGTLSPIYAEDNVETFPYPVKIDNGTIINDPAGKASFTIPRH